MSNIPETLAQALALHRQGSFVQAELLYRQVLRLDPNQVDALHLLGLACQQMGNSQEAIQSISEALGLRPDHAEAHYNLARIFQDQQQFDQAVLHYQHAVRLQPGSSETYYNLANTWRDMKRFDEAIHCYRQALTLKPDYARACNNLGNVYQELKQPEHAVQCLRQALQFQPGSAKAHTNLGNALRALGNLDEAEASCRESLRLVPNNPEAHTNLGAVYWDQGKPQEAIACFAKAIELKPDYARPHLNRGMALLLLGDYEQGWKEYEWRWRCPEFKLRPASQPLWDGTPLDGKTILLHAEQGLGDTLHFIRYASMVHDRGGKVIVECQPSLVRLLGTCGGIDQVVPHGSPTPGFDVHAPLLNLPGILGTTMATIPAKIPYLHADPALMDHWRADLEQIPGFKIGIGWMGNPAHDLNKFRSIPLKHFAPLARLSGVRLFSLQKGPGIEQLAEVDFPIINLGPCLDVATGAFMDTAAVMQHLDLVITSDTSIAHLAGALGVPTWLPLHYAAEWRWLRERTDTPWYPTMTLFRQQHFGDWGEVFDRLTAEVRQLAQQKPIHNLQVEIAPGELIDKITILEIKHDRIRDAAKLSHIRKELACLVKVREQELPPSAELSRLASELRAVNEKLWDIEDAIRVCERARDFGLRFIDLARSVYRSNDERHQIKQQINTLTGARFMEQKSYEEYA